MGRTENSPRPASRQADGRHTCHLPGLLTLFCALLLCLFPFQVVTAQPFEINAAINESDRVPGANPVDVAAPDWEGLKRDSWYFVGAQVASLGVLYTLPEAVSNWTEEQRGNFSLGKWRENVSKPHVDKDEFYLNYILHPYWGATYYVRARERGYGKLNSFWYSAFLSTLYEVGAEALFEQPSIQDLIVTPVFGAWLGEYFMGVRNTVRERASARGFRTRRETWVWYLTDPLALINSGVSRLLGQQASLNFRPLIGVNPLALQNRGTGIPGVAGPDAWARARLPAIAAGHSINHSDRHSGTRGGSTYLAVSQRNPLQQFQAGSRLHSGERAAGISITLSW